MVPLPRSDSIDARSLLLGDRHHGHGRVAERAFRRLTDARERQQIFDETLHPRQPALDDPDQVCRTALASPQQLRGDTHARQGSSQVVRNAAREGIELAILRNRL